MKRLTELPAEDRLTSRAHALLRAMGPTVESEERLRRVRRSLDAPMRPAAPRWGWRVGVALGVLGVSAAAAAGSSAVSRLLSIDQTAENQAPQATFASAASRPPIVAPAPAPAEHEVEPVRSPTPAASFAPPNAPTARATVPPLSDVARVHEAAKALRRDGDAERALQLLEHGAPVTGPLAEEALALRIEASAARGNGRQVKLAAAYLAQYPRGRYRELAKKALSGSQQ
jgi:hypothetical protein